LPKQAGYPE